MRNIKIALGLVNFIYEWNEEVTFSNGKSIIVTLNDGFLKFSYFF